MSGWGEIVPQAWVNHHVEPTPTTVSPPLKPSTSLETGNARSLAAHQSYRTWSGWLSGPIIET